MSTFHFQQFSVLQKHSAMKICTDATLFGAMMPISGGEQVLDIGSGNGLLALMAAQLGAGYITAVEITPEASQEATQNVAQSPWPERVRVITQDIQDYVIDCTQQFDLIISNPPFFSRHTKTTHQLRRIARHTDHLPFPALMTIIERLLTPEGRCYLLLPLHTIEQIQSLAEARGMHLIRRTDFRGFPHNSPKVCALLFSRQPGEARHETLTIYQSHREYTKECAGHLGPFLLRFATA